MVLLSLTPLLPPPPLEKGAWLSKIPTPPSHVWLAIVTTERIVGHILSELCSLRQSRSCFRGSQQPSRTAVRLHPPPPPPQPQPPAPLPTPQNISFTVILQIFNCIRVEWVLNHPKSLHYVCVHLRFVLPSRVLCT